MSHGWPGSVVEFHKVIGPLTDPVAHGGEVSDAFHLVVPSLPGYGFSYLPTTPGWSVERIAGLWVTLMGGWVTNTDLWHKEATGALPSPQPSVR